jgi:hypothetical protein
MATAYLDMMIALGFKCSRVAEATREQSKDVLVKYLADHPETRNSPAAFLAAAAFEQAFNCKISGVN